MSLEKYLGVPHVLGVASGTDALTLSLKACDIGPEDEVVVPAFSFFSTAGAVSWVNATPIFVDIESESLNINPSLIEAVITPKTKAIIVAHLNGRIAGMEPIVLIAKKHNLIVIEDAAQAIGATYKNNPVGFYGDYACMSFNPMKLLGGWGDGGAVATKDPVRAEKLSLLRTYGARLGETGAQGHALVGVSSRLPTFQAAVLSLKLEELEETIKKARKNYFLYAKLLRGITGVTVPVDPPADYFINGNRFIIFTSKRSALVQYLRAHHVLMGTPYSTPLPYLEVFRSLGFKKGDFPVAEKISNEIVVLPDNVFASEREVRRIAGLIKDFFRGN